MTEKTYIPFNEFYNPKKLIKNNQSVEKILTDVKTTLTKFKGRWTQ